MIGPQTIMLAANGGPLKADPHQRATKTVEHLPCVAVLFGVFAAQLFLFTQLALPHTRDIFPLDLRAAASTTDVLCCLSSLVCVCVCVLAPRDKELGTRDLRLEARGWRLEQHLLACSVPLVLSDCCEQHPSAASLVLVVVQLGGELGL